MSDDKRRQRKVTMLLQRESTWLQKAVFALHKAEEVRDKLADLRRESPVEYVLEADGKSLTMEDVEEALERRIETLVSTVRERRRTLR